MQKFKADMMITGALLLAAFLLFLIPRLLYIFDGPGQAVISSHEEVIGIYSLAEDAVVSVKEKGGEGFNLVLIEQGRVKVTDADCPDRLCVMHRSISAGGESIICLPHKLVIRIEAGKESDLDGIAG